MKNLNTKNSQSLINSSCKYNIDEVLAICKKNQLPESFISIVDDVYLPLSAWIAKKSQDREGAVVVGINGAQGSGKSTLCRFLEYLLLNVWEISTITISIDDLYKTRQERLDMAKNIHPLFKTRGVPGTHDVELGLKLFFDLKNMGIDGNPVSIPRFNKALDDRFDKSEWTNCTKAPKIILFEGWCVGAYPQPDKELNEPINRLEQEKDPNSLWRESVNLELKKAYTQLFNQIDHLIMLKVPSMEQVLIWRKNQEHKLAKSFKDLSMKNKIMTDEEIEVFVMHYQRLTEYMLKEMPQRADIVLYLNQNQEIDKVNQSLKRC
ncbi:MAG: phosphoribulokinase [Desulfamplus sp.]|nr:phosphoribulokinase [Desulfamplus sp.]